MSRRQEQPLVDLDAGREALRRVQASATIQEGPPPVVKRVVVPSPELQLDLASLFEPEGVEVKLIQVIVRP